MFNLKKSDNGQMQKWHASMCAFIVSNQTILKHDLGRTK